MNTVIIMSIAAIILAVVLPLVYYLFSPFHKVLDYTLEVLLLLAWVGMPVAIGIVAIPDTIQLLYRILAIIGVTVVGMGIMYLIACLTVGLCLGSVILHNVFVRLFKQ